MKTKILLIVLAILFLPSCRLYDILLNDDQQEEAYQTKESPTNTESPANEPSITLTPEPDVSEGMTLEEAAYEVVNALAMKDMAKVAEFTHPEQGVRFSPYTYVQESHQVFLPHEVAGLLNSDNVFNWGNYDGSGFRIDLTFNDYYEAFIYTSDFSHPEQTAVNETLGSGNMINNILEFYPGSSFYEFYFSGFEEKYAGMDWESLRLVFVQEGDVWYLVGIVHDCWTT